MAKPGYEELERKLAEVEAKWIKSEAEAERLRALLDGKLRAVVAGQSKTKDTALKELFRDNAVFADVFNNTILKDCPISPESLVDLDTNESAVISLRQGEQLVLQLIRDVSKGFTAAPGDDRLVGAKLVRMSGEERVLLAIFGVENQMHVDYELPLRMMQMQCINYSRQANIIAEHNVQSRKLGAKGTEGADRQGEFLSRFLKTDRLREVICLVIYYGEDVWDGPMSLEDMYVESGLPSFGASNPLHLLDVRHMDEKALEKYSDVLKPFFGCIRYEKDGEKLVDFIHKNASVFQSLNSAAHNALVEITGSRVLKQMEKECKHESGGVNYVSGIDLWFEEEVEKRTQQQMEQAQQQVEQARRQAQDAERKAAANMTERMITVGLPGEQIALITGLTREDIDSIAKGIHCSVAWGEATA